MTCTMNEILRIPISEARARLPELAQLAMESPGGVVIIEHRDYTQRLALTTEEYVRLLEETVMKLRRRLGAAEFRLAGSIDTDLTAEEMAADLAASRAEQARLDELRLQSMDDG